MGFFTPNTTVVQIDDENTITIRALTYGEEQQNKSKAMRVSAKMAATKKGEEEAEPEGEAVVDASLLQLLTLRTAIVSWEGPGFEGRKVSQANIEALPPSVLDPVIEAYNKLTKPLEDEEKNG